ncbi:2-enoyl thioester reductase domain-containing protein [Gramella sp. AN32]|uniref:MDR family NADPH-dependent oxidoreductase n=1 Tax=Christiangramia antarctica TaxID=2058158 RepID=A0ABW5X5C3_9FLAO|nr:2-enoyl thioester reductase domain-containing protein [Gramella sp. AN32]MCM4157820.1 hypothetical protein [Gramella sp. AN32]
MNSLVFEQTGKAEEVLKYKNIKTPKPAKGHILIKMLASPINPNDFMFIERSYRIVPEFPEIAGLEGTGRIFENGGDKNYPVGSLVAFRQKGTWAEYVTVPKENILKLPGNFPLHKAAQISLNPLTAWALLEQTNAKSGDYIILSAGNSSISRLISQFSLKLGVKTIHIVRNKELFNKSTAFGPCEVVEENKLNEFFEKFSRHHTISAFLDAVGGELASSVFTFLSPGAKVIHYGLLGTEKVSYYNSEIIFKNISVHGFGIDFWKQHKSNTKISMIWDEIIEIVSSEDFIMPVKAQFPLSEFETAIRVSKNKKPGKVLFIS